MIKRERARARNKIEWIFKKKPHTSRDVGRIKIIAILKRWPYKIRCNSYSREDEKTTTADWHTPVVMQSSDGCWWRLDGLNMEDNKKRDCNENGRSTDSDDVRYAYIARTLQRVQRRNRTRGVSLTKWKVNGINVVVEWEMRSWVALRSAPRWRPTILLNRRPTARGRGVSLDRADGDVPASGTPEFAMPVSPTSRTKIGYAVIVPKYQMNLKWWFAGIWHFKYHTKWLMNKFNLNAVAMPRWRGVFNYTKTVKY